MAGCQHKNIRVYVEVAYSGRLENGVVVYDDAKPEGEEVREVICLDCDKTFDPDAVATENEQEGRA